MSPERRRGRRGTSGDVVGRLQGPARSSRSAVVARTCPGTSSRSLGSAAAGADGRLTRQLPRRHVRADGHRRPRPRP